MSTYVCQKCYRTQDILKALGKLRHVDGYAQCKDCGSDLEREGVVVRKIHLDNRDLYNITLPQWLHEEYEKKGLNRKVEPLPRELRKEILAAAYHSNVYRCSLS